MHRQIFKLIAIFSIAILGTSSSQAATCPQGWTYYPKAKACQYYAPDALAINCTTIANQSYSATQTCTNVGNCRQSFVTKCQSTQVSCRKEIAQKCNNDAKCIKAVKCPTQFVNEGVVMNSTSSTEVQKVANSGGRSGSASTGSGQGGTTYSGGLGTGEGY